MRATVARQALEATRHLMQTACPRPELTLTGEVLGLIAVLIVVQMLSMRQIACRVGSIASVEGLTTAEVARQFL